jgi:hypothetical protein
MDRSVTTKRSRSPLTSATWVAASLATALLADAGVVVAQVDSAKAAAVAREAEDLLAQGQTAKACAKYDESFTLDPRGQTALDLAICREREGKIGRAYRMYGEAAELAEKEKRADRATTARSARNKLFLKVPKLAVNVPKETMTAGLQITINGEILPDAQYGKAWEVDTGALVIQASAPGRKKWETTVNIKERERKDVTVPQLAIDDNPVPVAQPVAVQPGAPAPQPGDPPPPPPPPTSARTEHDDNRLVVDIGAFGGFVFHDIERGDATELSGQTYLYNTSAAGVTVAECGETEKVPGAGECEAIFNSASGGLVGGQLFVGWALLEEFHLGARGFFGPRFPDGFFFGGGPSFSVRAAGPFWIGATFMFGVSEHKADIDRAEGTVPQESRSLNGDNDVVDIPLCRNVLGSATPCLDFEEGTVDSGLLLGGTVELSLSLFGPSPHALANTGDPDWSLLSGAVMASLWPTVLFTQEGFAIAVPVGFSYRFH